MVSRWCPGGVPVVSRWCPCGVPVVSRWCPGGFPVLSQWGFGGVPVVSRWCPGGCPGGFPVVSQWGPGGVPVVSRCPAGVVPVVSRRGVKIKTLQQSKSEYWIIVKTNHSVESKVVFANHVNQNGVGNVGSCVCMCMRVCVKCRFICVFFSS